MSCGLAVFYHLCLQPDQNILPVEYKHNNPDKQHLCYCEHQAPVKITGKRYTRFCIKPFIKTDFSDT